MIELLLLFFQRYSRGLILLAVNLVLILILLFRRWIWRNYGLEVIGSASKICIHNELVALLRVSIQYLVFIIATMGITLAGFYFSSYLGGTGSGDMVGFTVWWHGAMIVVLGIGIFMFNIVPIFNLILQYRYP